MKYILFILLFFTACIFCKAQDIHYSQYFASPLNFNPAKTGFFNGKYRIGLNSKSQWSSVTVPYQTISAYFDMQMAKRRYHRDAFGAGIVLNRDQAGDSKFSTTQAALSFSWIKALGRLGNQWGRSSGSRNNHLISFGLQAGWIQRSINYSDLYFDNQYNGDYYDSERDNGENFGRSSFGFFDIGIGTHWFLQTSQTTFYTAGLGVFHLTRPKITLFDNSKIRLDVKYAAYANAQFSVHSNIDLVPTGLFMVQGKYRELMLGVIGKYVLYRHSMLSQSVNVGIFTRTKDALVVMAGFDYNQWSFALSYDVNMSRLRPASKLRGGFEISLIYVHNKKKEGRKKEIPCPIF